MVPNSVGADGKNDLKLGADAPLWVAAEVPLSDENGLPLPSPRVGLAGHALALNDQQARSFCLSAKGEHP